MQSQGSTSSQPSVDSLSSSDSYLFSHSEQAEDDTDVFLSERSPSVILSTGGMVRSDGSAGADSPESQWACDGFTDREEDESRGSEVTGGHPRVTAERERTSETEREKTEGDLLFAQKCAELQGFVRPLLELLNGLKGGRFDRGLSSFQQSAAMDRIQRIVGILRRPNIGEKYMNTLLQVETMLKMWFPQVSPLAPPTAPTLSPPHLSLRDTPCSTPPHKHRDQSHIPVKKRRLSWSDTDSDTPPPVLCKRLNAGGGEERGKEGGDVPSAASGVPPHPLDPTSDQENERKEDEESGEGESSSNKAGLCSEPGPTSVLIAPILSPWKPRKGKQLLPVIPPPTTRGSPAMQDSVISSTTPFNNLQSQQQPIGCQSQPVAGKTGKNTLKTCQGRGQAHSITTKPLKRVERKSRVNPAPL
ncbi:uncharacterized protein LOC123484097 [Coregonus clupeaformis]|uniref:uncharacterized protein LOC123484097 n=1 Tax=Coregonus clupeaformis TaxID=59861 RepID=UPI001E1C5C0A|nr:uncharacterized protein LOC123484097 [Coregonus clupeaformis]